MNEWQDISTAPREDEARAILLWDGIGICIGRRCLHDGQIEGFAPDGERVSGFTHWAMPTYPQVGDGHPLPSEGERLMAGKPDDISQEAWDAAEACFPGNSWNPLTVERVARAIMAAAAAEREACAVAAEQHADTWIAGEAATTTGRMFQSACRSVAKTIRKRGEA